MDFNETDTAREQLDQLLQLDPHARQTLLDQLDRENPSLATRLRRWLADLASAEQHGFLATDDRPNLNDTSVFAGQECHEASETTASVQHPTATGMQPNRIGPYTIVQLLGRGGMGTVYLAEQQSPIARRVALKVVHRSTRTTSTRSQHLWQRFERETQLLAFLDHRHITRLYEYGTSVDGDPYFAMEYVDGPPISEFCDQHRLTLEARLQLFIGICEGVQHAHQKGIIHRDLKPANVLVKREEGVAVPKIIDFGIARALEPGSEGSERHAATVIGTPAYMSPEQLAGRADIDTRSDIYALGALLYKLLVGTTPLVHDGSLGLEERLRSLREGRLEPPSHRIRLTSRPSQVTAELRRVSPSTLRQRIVGDLDRICLKALAAERGQRYATVRELAGDLSCFLENRPVTATPPSTWYRLSRFIRRHRVGVLATTALFTALLLGFTATTQALWRARAAEREARTAAEQAQAAATRTQAAYSVLQNVLAAPDPYEAGIDVRVSELLARFPQALPKHLIDEQTEALLRQTIGRTYMSLGRHEEALVELTQAANLNRCLFGSEAPQTLASTLLRGNALAELGRFPEAKAEAEVLLDQVYTQFGARHEQTLRTQIHLAGVYVETRHFQEARVLGEAIIRRCMDTFGAAHPQTILLTNYLGQILVMQREFEQAAPYLDHALHHAREVYGPKHPRSLEILHNFLSLKVETGEIDQHLPLTEELVSLQEEVRGLNHPYSLGALSLRGHALLATNAHREALEAFELLLQRGESVFGQQHPRYAYCLQYLAKAAFAAGYPEQAVRHYRQALPIEEKAYGKTSIRVAIGRYNLGLVLTELTNQGNQAIDLLNSAAQVFRDHGEQAGLYFTLLALEPVMRQAGLHREADGAKTERLAIRQQATLLRPLSNMLTRRGS